LIPVGELKSHCVAKKRERERERERERRSQKKYCASRIKYNKNPTTRKFKREVLCNQQ